MCFLISIISYSDEEGDEEKQLLFLTITPEFDDLDENMQNEPPVIQNEKSSKKSNKNSDKHLISNQAAVATTSSASSSNIKHPVTIDIALPNAPINEQHPLIVGNRRPSSSTLGGNNANSGSNSSLSNMASNLSKK